MMGVNWYVYCSNDPLNYSDPSELAYGWNDPSGNWYNPSVPKGADGYPASSGGSSSKSAVKYGDPGYIWIPTSSSGISVTVGSGGTTFSNGNGYSVTIKQNGTKSISGSGNWYGDGSKKSLYAEASAFAKAINNGINAAGSSQKYWASLLGKPSSPETKTNLRKIIDTTCCVSEATSMNEKRYSSYELYRFYKEQFFLGAGVCL